MIQGSNFTLRNSYCIEPTSAEVFNRMNDLHSPRIFHCTFGSFFLECCFPPPPRCGAKNIARPRRRSLMKPGPFFLKKKKSYVLRPQSAGFGSFFLVLCFPPPHDARVKESYETWTLLFKEGLFDFVGVQTPEDILNAKRLIFPGVGAFAPAMDVLNSKGMAEALCTYIENDRPFLGICLGLQLLFESSEENGPVKGLGLIPGVVGRFDSSNGFRVPHIGWNALEISEDSEILDEISNRHVYFVHSYRAMPSDKNKDWISSTCSYGDKFIASVRRGNVHAVQFHPEKSGDVGLSVLRRFLFPKSTITKKPTEGKASRLAKRVIACLDVRANDQGDLVVTKGDQYDVREQTEENEVRNLGKPVELAGQYYKDGADEVSFLNITGFRDFPLGDLPMLQVLRYTSENVFVPLTVGGGIRDFKDANGRHYSSLEVASEYFRSGADKISIGSDAVYAAEEYLRTGVKTGNSSLEQISKVYGNQVRMERSMHGTSVQLMEVEKVDLLELMS
uniref:Glutamine amidotransferase domain-containing protein n=1 Tax=Cucumis sativus TaxID=3659 RepID=A0A0A0K785_CUCSA